MKSKGSLSEAVIPLGLLLFSMSVGCCGLSGCGDHARRPSAEELAQFEMAGPSGPSVDMDRVVQARMPAGPYRVVAGDVVRLVIPRILNAQSATATVAADSKDTYDCTIHGDGTIGLPVIGRLAIAGKSLAEIESAVIAEYYPKYVATPPPVHASMVEYKSRRVSVVGSVARPGVYALRHDQASVVALLMEAGGIADRGAAIIRITRRSPTAVPSTGEGDQVSRQSQTRVQEALQLAELGTAKKSLASLQTRSSESSPGVRAVFTREGPLNATGWLALEEGDRVVVRRWLDLASDHQRKVFLEAAAAGPRLVTGDELQARLSCLALYLQTCPQGGQICSLTWDSRWQAVSDTQFVTDMGGAVTNRGPARKAITLVAAQANPQDDAATTLVLPVRGLNIPFADVALEEGDSVVVEAPSARFISVVGLVRTPGNFPYPPDTQYDLIQAVAQAGGLDLTADPRYVSVYRLNADGTIASIRVRLVNPSNEEQLTEALALPLKPGDVVSVEHTLRTRTNVFLDRVFRISLGLYMSPRDFWDDI